MTTGATRQNLKLNAGINRVAPGLTIPANSRDAALLAPLNPGAYTAEATSVGSNPRTAIVEVCEVP